MRRFMGNRFLAAFNEALAPDFGRSRVGDRPWAGARPLLPRPRRLCAVTPPGGEFGTVSIGTGARKLGIIATTGRFFPECGRRLKSAERRGCRQENSR